MDPAAARPLITVQGLDDGDMATDESSTVVLPDVMTAPEEKNKEENIGSSSISAAKVEALEKMQKEVLRRRRKTALRRRLAALKLLTAACRLKVAATRALYGLPDLVPRSPTEVRILSLAFLSPGRPDIVPLVPDNGNPKGISFTLNEGNKYSLKFTFTVNNRKATGLRCITTVWRTDDHALVDTAKEILGTFSPQSEPYNHETAPSAMFAPGSYSAKTEFVDAFYKRYWKISYSFDIES